MNIGFVSTWYERGAAYVTKQYADLLTNKGNKTYIYARGGNLLKGDSKWDLPNVTWGKRMYDTNISFKHISKWIKKNRIEVLFFNEQREMIIVAKIKKRHPEIKIGAYIDYYTQETIVNYKWYDFLVCNTKRHYSVFEKHPQCFYIPWGTDIELFNLRKPNQIRKDNKIIFFHSAGMSDRKGTDILIESFIKGEIYKKANLIIHTQIPIEKLTTRKRTELDNAGIQIVEKTVTAPGLYHMGDVYVYPTTLDGLGLTMYEALAMYMPVITTDCAPMNEVITSDVGRLVEVEKYTCRWDAYYWPLAFVSEKALINAMMYYVNNSDKIMEMKHKARAYAVQNYNWADRADELNELFNNVKSLCFSENELNEFIKEIRMKKIKTLGKAMIDFMPNGLQMLCSKI